MNDAPKLLSYLGMCRKAGKISCGHDSAIGSVRSGVAKLCIMSSDSSERLRKEIEHETKFNGRNIPVAVIYSTMEEIGFATGLKSAVLSINDEGFAKAIIKLLNTNGEVNQ